VNTMADTNTVSRPENVVAHHVDGRVTKGQTDDFSPAPPNMHPDTARRS
jgi:hypothetical protein